MSNGYEVKDFLFQKAGMKFGRMAVVWRLRPHLSPIGNERRCDSEVDLMNAKPSALCIWNVASPMRYIRIGLVLFPGM